MYRGRIVEIGETRTLFANPAHPYTRELVDATPRLDRVRHREERSDAAIQESQGAIRSPGLHHFARNDELGLPQSFHSQGGAPEPNSGCPYASRCAFARPRCMEEAPVLEAKDNERRTVACHFPLD
jgi:peptide/nickel transport system ATP-binding protein